MDTFYWTPSNEAECERMSLLFHGRVDLEQTFFAFYIAKDAEGRHNGLRGERMIAFDPDAGGMILVPIAKA